MKKILSSLTLILAIIMMIFFSPFLVMRIVSQSMEPVIAVNDVIIVETWINKDEIQVGDIIAFKTYLFSQTQKDTIVHYVYSIEETDEGKVYQTIAHGAENPDRWLIHQSDIIGVYAFRIQGIGRVVQFLESWIGRIVLLMNAGLIIFWIMLDSPKKLMDQNEKK